MRDDAIQTALAVLLDIAEDVNSERDTRVRAACAILDYLERNIVEVPA